MGKIEPILKWVGGKRQLIEDLKSNMPKDFNKYHELFIGGGALLFDLQPSQAVINDVNKELINLYTVIKENVDDLIEDLKKHENTSEYFYEIRGLDRDRETFEKLSKVELASRMIYLNRTCFNGLYRVNSKNQFNVPFGTYKNPKIVDVERLKGISQYFNENDITILNQDISEAIQYINKGDFVYLDPPYDVISDTAKFTSYSASGFGRADQERLAEIYKELNNRGAYVMLSNANTDFIQNLYKEFDIKIVHAKRNINSKGTGRGKVEEVLVVNY